jgi:hypothetical protein
MPLVAITGLPRTGPTVCITTQHLYHGADYTRSNFIAVFQSNFVLNTHMLGPGLYMRITRIVTFILLVTTIMLHLLWEQGCVITS